MKYDLHIHSNLSDGKYDKLQLLRMINILELEVVSFADHNIFDDYKKRLENEYFETYKEKSKVKVINAAELDIADISHFHLLAYDMKDHVALEKHMSQIIQENNNITEQIVKKIFENYNIHIPIEELYTMSKDGNISKKTVIQWILNHGYAKNWNEAGYLFTGKYSPCYIKKKGLLLRDAIEYIQDGGGLSVFAHPSTINYSNLELEELIRELSQIGLNGIEVFNKGKTTTEQLEYYKHLADKYKLLTTCGSDFHNEIESATIGIEDHLSDEFNDVICRRR